MAYSRPDHRVFTPTERQQTVYDSDQWMPRFTNEVLIHGPVAVLPQHLGDNWLPLVEKLSSEYLDATYSLDECLEPRSNAAPLLLACVREILKYHQTDPGSLSDRELGEKLTAYALHTIIESVSRESGLATAKPSLDDIFSPETIEQIRTLSPAFKKTLDQACILRYPEKNFIEKAVGKLLAAVKR